MRIIDEYRTDSGRAPFAEWIEHLDQDSRAKIYAYIDRVAKGGSKKSVKALGEGVFEIKVDAGPGWRIYFGECGNLMVLLLLGGNKSTQRRDIAKAKLYWRAYNAKVEKLR